MSLVMMFVREWDHRVVVAVHGEVSPCLFLCFSKKEPSLTLFYNYTGIAARGGRLIRRFVFLVGKMCCSQSSKYWKSYANTS